MKPTELVNYRLQNGALGIEKRLEDINVEDIVFELYLPVSDPETRQLVYFYEKNMLLAKLNSKKHFSEQPKHIREIVNWIRNGKRYRLFADFSMYVSRNIVDKNKWIIGSYESALTDTWINIAPYGKMWYGMDGDTPLFMPELYGAYDAEAYELYKQRKIHPTEKFFKQVEAIDRKTEHDRINERNITNIVYSMISLINKANQDFIFPGRDWYDHVVVDTRFPRIAKPNEYYEGLFNQRSYLLDSEGITIQYLDSGLFKEIRFKEEFLADGMILLFRVTDQSDKHTMGFVDLRNGYMMTAWRFASPYQYHKLFMNFVLEVYCNLTCGIDTGLGHMISVETKDQGEPTGAHHLGGHKAYHKVRPFRRKGNASEMSIANASRLGLVLPPGYTFVREHTRGKNHV